MAKNCKLNSPDLKIMETPLARGYEATTYVACCQNMKDCNMVIRSIKTSPSNVERLIADLGYQIKAATLGVSIPVIDYSYDYKKREFMVLLPRLKETLGDRIESVYKTYNEHDAAFLIEDYIVHAINIIKTLCNNGISHNDSHIENFMFDDKDKLFIIDFGLTDLSIEEKIPGNHKCIFINVGKLIASIPTNIRESFFKYKSEYVVYYNYVIGHTDLFKNVHSTKLQNAIKFIT